MDRKIRLATAVADVLQSYVNEQQASIGSLKYHIAFDDAKANFFLALFGWQENERIYHLLTMLKLFFSYQCSHCEGINN